MDRLLETDRLSRYGILPERIRAIPLLFLHLPKTGGTSLTDAVAQLYGASRVFGKTDHITTEYLTSLGDRLSGSVFIAGHSGRGIVPWLADRADICTVLRNPVDHAVSNYLHIATHPNHPLHSDANELDFAPFLRRNPLQAHLQAVELARALSGPDRELDPRDPEDLRTIRKFLEGLPFVGTLDDAPACGRVLGHLLGLDRPLEFAMLNSAVCRGITSSSVERLRAIYEDLQEDPLLAPLFAAERELYRVAVRSLARADHRLSGRSGVMQTAGRGSGRREIAAHTFFSETGAMRGGQLVCSVPPGSATIVYGPYLQLPVGQYRIEFLVTPHAERSSPRMKIRLQIFANGQRSLAARRVRLRCDMSARWLCLPFRNRDPAAILEFRIRSLAGHDGALGFDGVRIVLAKPRWTIPAVLRERIPPLTAMLDPVLDRLWAGFHLATSKFSRAIPPT